MKASDYIVEFLINKGITDVFGYPGGMVTQLMDSFGTHSKSISVHVNYHEQGAAFAACGYAQTSGKLGVAYATSGPGATNLITGICNAYFDSIPTLFITGQVNRNESKGAYGVRQRGFQETDIVSIVKPITKYAVYVKDTNDLKEELEKAYCIAMSGRRGPVLIDIPMNIFRSELDISVKCAEYVLVPKVDSKEITNTLSKALNDSNAPVFIIGAGIKSIGVEKKIRKIIDKFQIPVVSSMLAFDVMGDSPNYYGFIGAYGTRTANFIVAKSDLVVTIGTRMDIRQVGINREKFAPNAKIIRLDVDKGELSYPVHNDEIQIEADLQTVIEAMEQLRVGQYHSWCSVCNEIKNLLSGIDCNKIKELMSRISKKIPDGAVITTDVGQNQVWVAQYFNVKRGQRVLFSGGHGAMGYALPAAIGAYYGSGKKPVYCITGDGGMQMNIQELQFVAREQLPIKIIIINNNALGMIRHFQEMYFDSRYYLTKPEGGYSAPEFTKIGKAYGINSHHVEEAIPDDFMWKDGPEILECIIKDNTYVFPKLKFGNPNQDQEPLLDRDLYEKIMNM